MTFALLTLTLLVLLGIPAALCLDPHLPGPALLGLGFLLGAGIMPLLLLTLSLLGIPWSVPGVAVSGTLITALLLFVWRQGKSSRKRGRHWDVPAAGRDAFVAQILDAFTAVAVLGHGIYASLARPGHWDFWSIWGFKGEAFWLRRGVDWSFLKDNANLYAHPDYPPLLPLVLDFFAYVRGGWTDRWMGLIFTGYGLALLLVCRELFREELPGRAVASLATLALAGTALNPWIGLAEGPLIAYGGLALLMIRRGLREESSSSFAVAGCLLGFAALTKNEGLALLVSVAMALFLDSALARRSLFRLWPAAVIVAFWWIPRTFHGLSSELVAGSLLHRVSAHLKDPIVFWKALASHWWQPFLWFCIAATLFFCRREIARRDRFLITAVVIQMAFYLFSYAASPYDLGWHISTSWPRLLSHLLLPLLFLALTCLVRALSGEKHLAEPRWNRFSRVAPPARPATGP